MPGTLESRFYTSADGLTLHALDFRPAHDAGHLPVVCLPGLTRGAVDFATLAEALAFASAHPRRVLAFDYRGRGRSDHDPDWRHYDLATERADVLQGLTLFGVDRAHFVGTSRGGLHIMAMAPTHRAMIASAIFNDIGPVIEPAGLRRIRGYVGGMVTPRSLDEAIALMKTGTAIDFDGLSPAEWRLFATTTFGTDEGALRLAYDPALARTLDAFDLDKPIPDSWALFDALRDLPVLTLRGANSDLLSRETLAAMERRWPASLAMEIPGQGHAPILADAATLSKIDAFLAACP
jgi:pimeloyl-ACP methyl ester carboxylesterase